VHGRYFALCNSPGTGKTRLAIETAQRKGYDYIYLSMRDPCDRFEPPPRPPTILHETLCVHGTTLGRWCYWIIAALTQYVIDDGLQTHDFNFRFTSYLPFWEKVLERYYKLVSENKRLLDAVECGPDPCRDAQSVFYGRTIPDLQDRTLCTALRERKKTLLFIVDGASVLLETYAYVHCGKPVTTFNMFRRALHCMTREFPVMTILVDSSIAVTNPVEKHVPDPHARALMYSENLLPPFYALPLNIPGIITGHASAAYRTSLQAGLSRQTLTLKHNPLQLAALSRPLFAAYLEQNLQIGIPRDRVAMQAANFAQRKLLYGYWLSQEQDTTKRRLQLFVVACVRLRLLPTARETQAEMVRRHLALCSGISEDRNRLIVQYKSEPIIAEAAMRTVLSDQIFLEMLQEVCSHLRAGTVLTSSGVGDTSELLAAIIMMRANDMAIVRSAVRHRVPSNYAYKLSEAPTIEAIFTDKHAHEIADEYDFANVQGCLSRPVPLLHLLESLFSEEEFAIIHAALVEHRPRLLAAAVCYNHHQRLCYDPQPADLRGMLQRYAAGLCRGRNQGIDLMIPLALPLPGAKSVDVHSSASYDIGVLAVAGVMCAKATIRSLDPAATLFLLLSANNPSSGVTGSPPPAVFQPGHADTDTGGAYLQLQKAHCLTDAGKPRCITTAMLAVLNKVRGSGDLLGFFEEDQLAGGAAVATIAARKRAIDPGSSASDAAT
jgi:hypothetical protein